MLQNLSEEIRECLSRAEECKWLSKTAPTGTAIKEYLEMEQRWLALAQSYEFAERLSRFTEPFRRKARDDKKTGARRGMTKKRRVYEPRRQLRRPYFFSRSRGAASRS